MQVYRDFHEIPEEKVGSVALVYLESMVAGTERIKRTLEEFSREVRDKTAIMNAINQRLDAVLRGRHEKVN